MFTTLDKITKSILVKKRLPRHFYVEMLKHSMDCLRELTFDTLKIVNTVELVIDPNSFSAELPCDYVDWTKIGVRVGQKIRPIYEVDSINRLQATALDGQPTTYTNTNTNQESTLFPGWPGYWLFQNMNDLGENTGRLYGIPAANETNGFKIIPEGNRIQFTETFKGQTAVLEYISNGLCVTDISRVNILAQATIEAYDDWQYKHHGKRPMNDVMMAFEIYKKELRKLRARMSDLTLVAIKQALYNNYKLSIKN